MTKQRYVYW